MESFTYKIFLLISCILAECSVMTVEAKSHVPESISELQDYFGKEINKIGKKFEIAMKNKKQLALDINQLNIELQNERKEKLREIKKVQENFKSVENQFLNEIINLKTELAKSREEHKIELDRMKEELMTTQHELRQKMTHCQQKLVANEPMTVGNDQTDRVAGETNTTENEHISKASPESFDIKVKRGETGAKRQSPLNGSRVAFFARLTQTTAALNINQGLVFDSVVTNVGRAYQNSTGTFIAPMPGVYVFTTSILAYGTSSHHVRVVKNGQLLAKIDFNDADSFDDSSQTVIVELDKGDIIAIQNADYTGMVYNGDFYSTFSGFLLYEYEDASEIVGK